MKDTPLHNLGRNLLVFFQFIVFTTIGMVALSYLKNPFKNILIGIICFWASVRLLLDIYKMNLVGKIWGLPVNFMPKMGSINRKSRSFINLFTAMIRIILLIIIPISIIFNPIWLVIAYYWFVVWFHNRLLRLSPPLFLYLSSGSDEKATQFFSKVYSQAIPYAAYSLQQTNPKDKSMINYSVRQSNYRTWPEIEWQSVAFELMDITKVIILDARFSSPAIIEETSRIINSDFVYKTVLVIDNNCDQQLLLKSLDPPLGSRFSDTPKFTENEVLSLIKSIVKDPESIPIKEN